MDYSKIIAVSGLPGLYELISSKNDGAIVRSLDDKSSRFVSSRIHNFSHLESIEIYTIRDNVNLVDILQSMQKNSGALPDTKDNAAIKKYFETVYPDLDFERVYASDMKKIIKWFEVLKNNNVEIKLTEQVEEEITPVVPQEPVKEKVKEEVSPKNSAAKTVKAKKETAPEAAPKKKEAAKVKEKPKEEAPKKAASKTTKTKKEDAPEAKAPKKKASPKKK